VASSEAASFRRSGRALISCPNGMLRQTGRVPSDPGKISAVRTSER